MPGGLDRTLEWFHLARQLLAHDRRRSSQLAPDLYAPVISARPFRPVEDYSQLGEDWLKGKPPELATLLGRDDFLQHQRLAEGFADPTKLAPVFASVQAAKNIPRRR
jgi:hypothetical protein